MSALDWIVLIASLTFIVVYGIWKTKGTKTAKDFLSGGNQSPWWVVGLSVMATQASAITFLSTPGQAFHDGLGFVQFYFGLPIALVILCVYVLPRYFSLNVYTAYEYLENRFGLPTRLLTSFLFLIQRGLAAGLTIYAPAIVLSSILDWNLHITCIIIGVLVIIYTLIGGTEAVNQTQKQQMLIIFVGMFIAFGIIVQSLPMPFGESLHLAGSLDKLKAVDTHFDWNSRYNLWSAFLGGTFLFLSYFGTDQSQVQRYLSGKDLGQARIGLLFNALFKVPMQFFILMTGVMVFIFFQFTEAPLHFNPNSELAFSNQSVYQNLEEEYQKVFEQKIQKINFWKSARANQETATEEETLLAIQALQNQENEIREKAKDFIKTQDQDIESNDKDYVFIHFILYYLPHGVIGLLLAVILSAAMSSTSSELNALATTTAIDIYKRNFAQTISDEKFLKVSRGFTFMWGVFAIVFALKANLFENLIQAVNIIGSLFYGVILGVFAIAFLFPKVKGKAVWISIILVEPFIIFLYYLNEIKVITLEFLWLNPIGCLLLILVASIIQNIFNMSNKPTKT